MKMMIILMTMVMVMIMLALISCPRANDPVTDHHHHHHVNYDDYDFNEDDYFDDNGDGYDNDDVGPDNSVCAFSHKKTIFAQNFFCFLSFNYCGDFFSQTFLNCSLIAL